MFALVQLVNRWRYRRIGYRSGKKAAKRYGAAFLAESVGETIVDRINWVKDRLYEAWPPSKKAVLEAQIKDVECRITKHEQEHNKEISEVEEVEIVREIQSSDYENRIRAEQENLEALKLRKVILEKRYEKILAGDFSELEGVKSDQRAPAEQPTYDRTEVLLNEVSVAKDIDVASKELEAARHKMEKLLSTAGVNLAASLMWVGVLLVLLLEAIVTAEILTSIDKAEALEVLPMGKYSILVVGFGITLAVLWLSRIIASKINDDKSIMTRTAKALVYFAVIVLTAGCLLCLTIGPVFKIEILTKLGIRLLVIPLALAAHSFADGVNRYTKDQGGESGAVANVIAIISVPLVSLWVLFKRMSLWLAEWRLKRQTARRQDEKELGLAKEAEARIAGEVAATSRRSHLESHVKAVIDGLQEEIVGVAERIADYRYQMNNAEANNARPNGTSKANSVEIKRIEKNYKKIFGRLNNRHLYLTSLLASLVGGFRNGVRDRLDISSVVVKNGTAENPKTNGSWLRVFGVTSVIIVLVVAGAMAVYARTVIAHAN